MSEEKVTVEEKESKLVGYLKKFGILAAVLVVVFLLGFVPQWMQLRTERNNHSETKSKLVRSDVGYVLSKGLVAARRGEYEASRKDLSTFFSVIDSESRNNTGAFSEKELEDLKKILSERDGTITMLARRDNASVKKVTDIYMRFHQATGDARPTSKKDEDLENKEEKDRKE